MLLVSELEFQLDDIFLSQFVPIDEHSSCPNMLEWAVLLKLSKPPNCQVWSNLACFVFTQLISFRLNDGTWTLDLSFKIKRFELGWGFFSDSETSLFKQILHDY